METSWLVTLMFSLIVVDAKIYLKEQFGDGDAYTKRWISSTSKGAEQGAFEVSAGNFYGDAEKDKGLRTTQDARFYGISTKFESFGNEGKTLVVQFQVKHEQDIDCGGGYVKIFDSSLESEKMHGETPYLIMFGPDICGNTKKVHVIFTYKGKNHLVKKDISCKHDEYTHLYTLIVRPDNTYEVRVDGEKQESGSLEEDWDMLPAKEILDPDQKKPDDWVDEETIPDPDDKKPDDWEKPQHIPDPEAKKPTDWDDEMDGEWEPAMIDNPEYKGEWKPKQMPNPAYKGQWEHPKIPNPEYSPEPFLYRYEDIGAIGFDLWQVKSGTIFDNVLIGDDVAEAEAFAKDTFDVTKEAEKKMKEEQDAEKLKKDEEEAKDKDDKDGEDDDKDGEDDDKDGEDDDKDDEDKADDVETDDEKHDEL